LIEGIAKDIRKICPYLIEEQVENLVGELFQKQTGWKVDREIIKAAIIQPHIKSYSKVVKKQ